MNCTDCGKELGDWNSPHTAEDCVIELKRQLDAAEAEVKRLRELLAFLGMPH